MISIGDRIKAIRQAKNLKQGDLAKRLGMTAAQLCRIEGEKHAPSVKTIARVAKALGVSVAELMTGERQRQNAVPPCSSDNTRDYALDANAPKDSPDKLQAIRETAEPTSELNSIKKQLIQKDAEYANIENELGIVSATTLQLAHPFSPDERGAEILARALRTSCDAGSMPFSDLVGLLESRNVRIVMVKCSPEIQSRAFYNADTHVLMLAINRKLTPERQLYRIAYELGYACVFGSTGFAKVTETPALHRFVRRFAAAFLMPEDAIRGFTTHLALGPTNWTMGLLLQLKCKFGVSAETFAHRLEKIGVLAPALRKRFKEELRNYYDEHDGAEPSPAISPIHVDTWLTLLKLRGA